MTVITLEDARTRLEEVIAGLNPGEPLIITKDGEAVATLTRSERIWGRCKAGSFRTSGYWMSPDFDAPLDEFREHME